jgi:hypothetical protein
VPGLVLLTEIFAGRAERVARMSHTIGGLEFYVLRVRTLGGGAVQVRFHSVTFWSLELPSTPRRESDCPSNVPLLGLKRAKLVRMGCRPSALGFRIGWVGVDWRRRLILGSNPT